MEILELMKQAMHKKDTVVTVQVFDRANADEIEHDSLKKYVGVVKSYSYDKKRNVLFIYFDGGMTLSANMRAQIVEVY